MDLYVGNLGYDVTADEVRAAFEQYGQVDAVRVPTDRDTGRSRGFAFVVMPDGEEARRAISGLNGSELAGRTLRVRRSEPRPERRTQYGRRRA